MMFVPNTANAPAPRMASRFAYGKKREIRDYSGNGFSESELRAFAPTIFAEGAHESRSKRYTYIPTSAVLAGLQREGFVVTMATRALVRDESKRGFEKHMLRLRHRDQLDQHKGGVNELLMLNSHDGASAYHFMAGCFEFVCSNGLIVGEKYGEVRVRHSGNVQDEVIEGAYRLMGSFAEIDNAKAEMSALRLTEGEQTAFARAALAVRFPDHEPAAMPLRAEQVIEPRRYADAGADLWSTFNRAQENLVGGGQETTASTRTRRRRTRAVQGIDGNVALNRGLWTLAEEMQKLKSRAA